MLKTIGLKTKSINPAYVAEMLDRLKASASVAGLLAQSSSILLKENPELISSFKSTATLIGVLLLRFRCALFTNVPAPK